jgi:hypothetical protein
MKESAGRRVWNEASLTVRMLENRHINIEWGSMGRNPKIVEKGDLKIGPHSGELIASGALSWQFPM